MLSFNNMFKVDYKTTKQTHRQYYNKFYKHNLEEHLWQTNINLHLHKTSDNPGVIFSITTRQIIYKISKLIISNNHNILYLMNKKLS